MTTELAPYLDYDLDTAKAETQEQQQAADDDSQVFTKARDGENAYRIIPPPMAWGEWFEKNGLKPTPFIMVWKHFFERPEKPGSWVSTPCPAKMGVGSVCPLCQEAARLRSTGDPLDDELGWDMTAKHKALVSVIDRDAAEIGPLVWEISAPIGRWKGRTMYERVRALMTGRNAVNIVTPTDKGHDIILTKSGKGRTGTNYTIESLHEPSPLSQDPAEALAWINGQHDLRRFVIPPTPEQMAAIIEGRSQRGTSDTGGSRAKVTTTARTQRAITPAAPAQPTAADFVVAEVVDEEDLQF